MRMCSDLVDFVLCLRADAMKIKLHLLIADHSINTNKKNLKCVNIIQKLH